MKVVVDAGPIVALSKAGQLTLLPQLFDEVVVPQSVIEEVAGHGETRPCAEIAHLPWAHVKADAAGRSKLQERYARFRVDLKRSSGKISSCGKSLQVPFSGFSYSLVRFQ